MIVVCFCTRGIYSITRRQICALCAQIQRRPPQGTVKTERNPNTASPEPHNRQPPHLIPAPRPRAAQAFCWDIWQKAVTPSTAQHPRWAHQEQAELVPRPFGSTGFLRAEPLNVLFLLIFFCTSKKSKYTECRDKVY